MPKSSFDKCVFINCPFDEDYSDILQAILFVVLFLGFTPRLATESADSGDNRLERIISLIEDSRYSIHDLSRCQARKKGEHFRLNMPFELGVDFACKRYFGKGRDKKRTLILEEKPYRYQAALSDIAGLDIQTHGADWQKAVEKVRNWLVSEAAASAPGPTGIRMKYAAFQEWHYERLLADGFSDDDIQKYPTSELLESMSNWIRSGMPVSFS